MSVRWTDEATNELNAILTYLQSYAPDVARGLTERVLLAEQNIETFPQAATFDRETNTYDRYIPRTRVILTYNIQEDFIEIVRVWHTSRNPETKPSR